MRCGDYLELISPKPRITRHLPGQGWHRKSARTDKRLRKCL